MFYILFVVVVFSLFCAASSSNSKNIFLGLIHEESPRWIYIFYAACTQIVN